MYNYLLQMTHLPILNEGIYYRDKNNLSETVTKVEIF